MSTTQPRAVAGTAHQRPTTAPITSSVGITPGVCQGTVCRRGYGTEVPDEQAAARRKAGWRFLWRAIARQRVGVAGAIVSGLAWQAAAVAGPLVIKQALDEGVLANDRSALYRWTAVLVAVGAVEAVAGAFRHVFAVRNRARSDAAVRDGIFTHALGLDAAFHDRVGPGDLMSRASNDAELIARLLDSIGHTVGYLLTVVAVAVVLLLIDLPLALVVLVPLPLIAVGFCATRTATRNVRTGFRRSWRRRRRWPRRRSPGSAS
jgi:ABC-type multidrug transport system fused ATPase/permease subunit